MVKKRENPVYAFATARHEYGYGHLDLHIYELFGYSGPTLKIGSQTGSGGGVLSESESRKSYCWQYGLSADYGLIHTEHAHKGFLLLRRIDKQLAKIRDERGSAETYAEYVVRVLRAANVRRVHVNPGVNAGYSCPKEQLPTFDPFKEGDDLALALHNMEQALLARV